MFIQCCYNSFYRSVFLILSMIWMSCLLTGPIQAQDALKLDDIPGLYKRILTLPGAKLYKQPQKTASLLHKDLQPPVLTPLYVYQEKKSHDGLQWLACGNKPENGLLGWIRKSHTEIWKTQLVLELIPRDQINRPNRVVFYKNWENIRQLMEQRNVATLAKNDLELIETNTHDPNRIVAVEPAVMADSRSKAYLIPVIDYKLGGFSNKYRRIKEDQSVGFEVALLNLEDNKVSRQPKKNNSGSQVDVDSHALNEIKKYKVGMVFLMDTTQSMGDYIQLTYDTIETIYDKLKLKKAVNSVSFGLVGYRDYVAYKPGIEYVTKIFQSLEPNMKPEIVLKNLSKVKPSNVTTDGFKEDMYAGLDVVVNQFDWRPFDGRFIILVTDASAREPGDPHSKISREQYAKLKFNMDEKKLKVYPLHVKTSAAEIKGDFLRGQKQFSDPDKSEFHTGYESGIPAEDRNAFKEAIDQFSDGITDSVEQIIQGKMVKPKESESNTENPIEQLVVNEIFKTQLEFLGRQEGVDPPDYFHGWVSGIDLTRPAPDHQVVTGKYLLTRNQLNDLAKRIDSILKLFDKVDSESFRKEMLAMSTQYSTDPDLEVNLIGDTGVLPAYLKDLPYQSQIMSMSAKHWNNYSEDKQQAFRSDLKDKLSVYSMINEDFENWIDLGEGQDSLKVYPVAINLFP